MKKRILTLLLAGLMAMSAVGCNEPTENPNATGDPNGTTSPVVTDESGYQIVNETVYSLVAELNLRLEANTAGEPAKKLGFAAEMTRIKYGSRWSVVVYEGAEYYVMSEYLTTDDLGLKTFTAMSDTIVHATTAGVNVRLYPSTSTLIEGNFYKKLTRNETVTAIAQNSDWYQIRLDGKKYYVSKQYFAEGAMPSVNDLGDYVSKFNAGKLDTPTTMYISENSVRVRQYPSTEEYSSVITSYIKDTPVTVIAVAKIEGYKWAQVLALEDPDDPASNEVTAYIRYDMLSLAKGADNTKLESLITAYGFVDYDTNVQMFVASNAGGLRVRTSPIIPEGDNKNDNVYASLTAGQEVTAVAYGTGEYQDWVIISYSKDDTTRYHFVSKAYLTSNAGGVSSLTSESYKTYGLTLYTGTPTKTVKVGGAYTYLTPDLNLDNKSSTLAAGATVTVIAEGSYTNNNAITYSVYFVKDANGSYWFINQYKVS
ncbi:MAG: hypothetical protein IJW16_03180 [Clostridia bacterium]|nr:hypothetical protein [Clostridia bacterium]